MLHLPSLIQDLGVILMAAAAVTLLCRKYKQPVVLGYLIAGFLVGPHVPIIPKVNDTASIHVWAEIGVIFLLFSLGLEFSFKKLTKVGKSASITALIEILFMLGIGYSTGQFLEWSKMDSLFLGGILSISSTTIIVRAFEELKLKGRNFVNLVFGVLIVEDLLAILLLVLLSSVAATQALSGSDLILSSMKLVFFLVLWFLLGIYALPIFLKRAKNYLTDETMLIFSIGLCLFMVMVATNVGFSPALGAFVMGSIFAETREGKRIEHVLLPVRNLFAAIFFVSVGMLLNPAILIEYFHIIIIIIAITIMGKVFSTTVGALISGRSLKHSVQAGMSLAQIGEFSFIIATLGLTLKVTSDFLYPIAVAVSAVTTFLTPYMIKCADQFYFWLNRRLPSVVTQGISRYEMVMSENSQKNILALVWEEYGTKILFNFVLIIAITLSMSRFALPSIGQMFGELVGVDFLVCGATLFISAPFLWALILGTPSHTNTYNTSQLMQLRRLQFGLSLFRMLLGIVMVGFIISEFTDVYAVSSLVLIVAFVGMLFFSKYAESFYQTVENRFLSNLNETEKKDLTQKALVPELAPWNATLVDFVISPHSKLVAKSILESKIKESFGVTIAMIERGEMQILAPGASDLLLPYDRVFLIGTDEQIEKVRHALEDEIKDLNDDSKDLFGLDSVVLPEKDHRFNNKTIHDCAFRDVISGLIIGIERSGKRFLNPDSSMKLQSGDVVWIVGNLQQIKVLREELAS